MNGAHEDERVRLSAEDRVEMQRLAVTAQRALHEMSQIVGRTLGQRGPAVQESEFRFKARQAAVEQPGERSEAPVLQEALTGVWEVCSEAGCGCYDYDSGYCYPKG